MKARVSRRRMRVRRDSRPWGAFYDLDGGAGWHLKTIYIKPCKRLSLQYHHSRSEIWILVEGDVSTTIQNARGTQKTQRLRLGVPFRIEKRVIHRLASKRGGTLVEVALGRFDENDIVRLEDDHGRVQWKKGYGKKRR